MDKELYYQAKNKLRRTVTHAARRLQGKPRLVASLTSYPARISTVHVAIQSLLAQHCLPDLIVLYLCKSEFPNGEADLPIELRRQLAHDVQIRWVDDNLKPHKKYYWALQEFTDDLVMTFDDDLVYRNTLVQDLVDSYQKHPEAISAIRTHLITFDNNGNIDSYPAWVKEAGRLHPELVGIPTMQLFATNGAGVLFPPHIMPKQTFDKETLLELCPSADDIWLKCMETIAGIPVVAATAVQGLVYVPDSQNVGLLYTNVDEGGNDNQLLNVVKHHKDFANLDINKVLRDKRFDGYKE